MRYNLQINPFNPVEYLACCGLFEILVRFDLSATAYWSTPHEGLFQIESLIDEGAFLRCLKETLCDYQSWKCDTSSIDLDPEDDNEEEESDAEEEESAGEGQDSSIMMTTFRLNDQTQTFAIDWWYETLKKDQTINNKSGWKMYAGNQTVERIVQKMTMQIRENLPIANPPNLTELLKLSAGMTGRFGFDPRSTRNALEAGYSPNDLKLKVPTWPVAELLAGIGANYFFPPRTRPDGGTTSARGWIEDRSFQYALWQSPLPITLARLAAAGGGFDQQKLCFLMADRVNRDKYSNFKMARTVRSRQER